MKLIKKKHKDTTGQIDVRNLKDDSFAKGKENFIYSLALICLVLIALLFIECKHPYFFLQDDNRDYFLPYFIHNYESLLSGKIPLYNFHQFFGIPSLAVGQTGALYPISYLSVFFSKCIFGHYFAAIDIQVILHLLIGAVGFFKFIRFFEADNKVAFFGGLTWILSSFVIYVSDSWLIVATVAAYFPWMLLGSFRLYKNPSAKTTIYAVMIRLFLFYSGHIQYFVYSVIFEFITVIAHVVYDSSPDERKANAFKYIKKYMESYIYVLIFSLPLLLPMWHLTSISAQRSGKLPFAIFCSQFFPIGQIIKGLFYPFSQVDENTLFSFRNMINLSHIGYITLVLIAMGIAEKFITKSKNIKINSVRLSVFVRPVLVALVWSTSWPFNLIIYCIPILNRFRWPFKLAFYFDFYLIVIAALLLHHFIKKLSWKEASKNILFCLIISIQVFNFLFLYAGTPYKDFGEHHVDKLPLEEKLKDKLTGGRIISAGFDIWIDSPQNNHDYLTAPTLGFNYATLWGLDYFAGYEVMLPKENQDASLGLNFDSIIASDYAVPIQYLRKAGVRWYVVPRSKLDEYTKKLGDYGIVKQYEDEYRAVFYDAKAYPMVFKSNGEQVKSNDYHVTTDNIELDVDLKQPDNIIFNYVYNSFFEGYIDGKKTNLTAINKINLSIFVPEGKHHILIKYRDPYFNTGIYIAGTFLIIITILGIIRILFKRKER